MLLARRHDVTVARQSSCGLSDWETPRGQACDAKRRRLRGSRRRAGRFLGLGARDTVRFSTRRGIDLSSRYQLEETGSAPVGGHLRKHLLPKCLVGLIAIGISRNLPQPWQLCGPSQRARHAVLRSRQWHLNDDPLGNFLIIGDWLFTPGSAGGYARCLAAVAGRAACLSARSAACPGAGTRRRRSGSTWF